MSNSNPQEFGITLNGIFNLTDTSDTTNYAKEWRKQDSAADLTVEGLYISLE